jgi:hypothetical protein
MEAMRPVFDDPNDCLLERLHVGWIVKNLLVEVSNRLFLGSAARVAGLAGLEWLEVGQAASFCLADRF